MMADIKKTHIILTHEQADFDALASLLAAHLLHDYSIPILPRRINRNVQAFLTLYGMEFPFIDPRDLHLEHVDITTLVDTQSLISVKGMGPDTSVQVIDHHPMRGGLPDDWSITTIESGSTTTLLVEMMQEKSRIITPMQATLMLLGIYEDTGSLTYTRTTPRDLSAAAYLLEQGADLQIAGRFLNLPLSEAQQKLYDQLITNTKVYNVHGFRVITVKGDASELDEELSSIAHKMCDLLDPDALFLEIKTRAGVQLIARSNRDNIDVAEILSGFGGGGHDRAAACLIRDQSAFDIHSKLMEVIKKQIKPSITVSHLMSFGPQLLSPDTTVQSALESMRRYGYEGYPVVKNGKTIGLLTRRAVDRAIAHKLDLSAEKIMEAGNHTVTPDDSIEHLQKIMTETGWGQIPVVDPSSSEIIGIVTRTDLLKTLSWKTMDTGRQNLNSLLEKSLPNGCLNLLKAVAQTADQQQVVIYIVGGFVRDLLLEHPSLDFDLVVEGDAIKLAKRLSSDYGGRVTSHSRFGTAKWHLENHKMNEKSPNYQQLCMQSGLRYIDFVSARMEFYTYPTALPTVEKGSIKLDLHRRDFTINTLALRLDGNHFGELYDYWGGYKDLQDGLVRVLHSLSFIDDPTRILRAVRFEQRFNFNIEKRTIELLQEALPLLNRLSGDRIRHELDSIFIEFNSPEILKRLDELNVLRAINPALTGDDWFTSRLRILKNNSPEPYWELDDSENELLPHKDISYTLWLIRLSPKEIRNVVNALRIQSNLEEIIFSANKLWSRRSEFLNASPSKIFFMLMDVNPLSIYSFYIALDNKNIQEEILNFVQKWRHIQLSTDGNALKQRGIPPGPIYRNILNNLRAAKLDGKFKSAEEEYAYLDEVLEELNIKQNQ